jgi:hypothetical protein
MVISQLRTAGGNDHTRTNCTSSTTPRAGLILGTLEPEFALKYAGELL